MDYDKVKRFLEEARQKESEKKIMTYDQFLEEIRRIQLPKWGLDNGRIRSADSTSKGPTQVLAGFISYCPVFSPKECASALNLEYGEDLALIIMKAEDNEWMSEKLVQRIRKDLLQVTGLK